MPRKDRQEAEGTDRDKISGTHKTEQMRWTDSEIGMEVRGKGIEKTTKRQTETERIKDMKTHGSETGREKETEEEVLIEREMGKESENETESVREKGNLIETGNERETGIEKERETEEMTEGLPNTEITVVKENTGEIKQRW